MYTRQNNQIVRGLSNNYSSNNSSFSLQNTNWISVCRTCFVIIVIIYLIYFIMNYLNIKNNKINQINMRKKN
jgi:hypothetical protein